jgi:hypothetical protein
MRRFTLLGWKLAVLVVAMLAAIGAWEVYKGTVGLAQSYAPGTGVPPETPADHFVCYKAHATPHQQKFVATAKIENQFEYTVVRAKDYPRLLCVPTKKELISLEPRTGHDDDDDYGNDYGNDYGKGKKGDKGKKK